MNTILENWINGKGLPGTLAIDGHIHIGEWPHAATFTSADAAICESRRFMESNGLDAFCALSGGYMFGKMDYHMGNEFLLAVWRGLGDLMIPFLNVNPNDKWENLHYELEKMHDEDVHCVKLINTYQDYPGDGPNLMRLYEFAASRGMLVTNHLWKEAEIRKIASLYPETDFIFAHYTGGFQDAVLTEYPNVYTNVWYYGSLGWLERGIKTAGARKFMMGSDGFLNCLSVGIGPVVFSDISDDEKRMIIGLNMARLLYKAGVLPVSLRKKAGLFGECLDARDKTDR